MLRFVFGMRMLVLFSLVLLIAPIHAVAAADDVVAQVGSISVTKYEFGREFQRIYPLRGSFHGNLSEEKLAEIKEEALDKCIERALKAMYALDNEIAPDVSVVNSRYEQLRGGFGTDGEFKDALGGETPEAFRSSLFRDQLASAAEKIVIDDKVTVSDKDIRKYYDENDDKFMRATQYQASHILIKVDPAATKEQRQERQEFAKGILAKALAGDDFYDLAYYNSDDRTRFVGGDIGFFTIDQAVVELGDVVKSMKVGEISDLVRTIYGYHIVKLTDLKPAGRMSFEEVQVSLVPQMKKAHRDKLYEDWISELKARYPVEKIAASE